MVIIACATLCIIKTRLWDYHNIRKKILSSRLLEHRLSIYRTECIERSLPIYKRSLPNFFAPWTVHSLIMRKITNKMH
jgi:hypothetical protein